MRQLETKRLILRKIKEEDAQQMFDCWASDPEVTKYVSWDPHKNVDETKELLKTWIEECDTEGMLKYGITLKEDNTLIGLIDVFEFRDGKPALGYAIGKKYWGQGYVSEAFGALLDELKNLGYKNILIEADERNIASNKIIQRFGFDFVCKLKRDGTQTYPGEVTVNTYELKF